MNTQPRLTTRRPRRARSARTNESNILTGGSRDYKPEYMTFSVTAANNASATTAIPLPVMRNFSSPSGAKAQVIEALKFLCEFPQAFASAAAYTDLRVHLSTKNHGTVATTLADPDTFAVVGAQSSYATNGAVALSDAISFDFTDGMGNGILLATDNIYAQLTNTATGQSITCSAKLFYRIYSASVTEYVGIVQSQQ
nr:hypothetical protein [Tolivirales sp.]